MFKGKQFLLYDTGPGSNEWIIIFHWMKDQLICQSQIHGSAMETLNWAPNFVLQLYVKRIKKYNKFITYIFCLLKKKLMVRMRKYLLWFSINVPKTMFIQILRLWTQTSNKMLSKRHGWTFSKLVIFDYPVISALAVLIFLEVQVIKINL